MHELASPRERRNGKAGIRSLRVGNVIHVFQPLALMRQVDGSDNRDTGSTQEMATEQTTVLIFELRHKGDLPESLAHEMERRAYDYCATKGTILLDQTRQVLPIREMK